MGNMGDEAGAITFSINGVKHSVGANDKISPETALVDYIRDVANLKGTKVMCREGGCGVCLVTAKVIDPSTGSEITKSVNSVRLGPLATHPTMLNHNPKCLTPVLSCDGWDISTVESLGNKQEGYHVVQNRIVNFHGTQCGFCTPGMVMNMYSLLQGKKDLVMEDVEKSLDGNICRCTGYRPILDSLKTLTKDVSEDLQKKCADIEDCGTCPIRKQNGQTCQGRGNVKPAEKAQILKFENIGEEWITAKTLEDALTAAATANADNNAGSIRFIAGNTSTGIFKHEGPFKTFIDINGIQELKTISINDTGITIGGGTTLTELINVLKQNSTTPGLEYGSRVATHLERVANISVRNITRRYQNAHAYVNAALVLKVSKDSTLVVEEKPRFVYGGVSENFIHATSAEESLHGKSLVDPKSIADALQALESEVKPEGGLLESSCEYRIQLVKSLLYKTILEIVGDKVGQRFRSGASDITRILTKGKQTFETDATDVSLYKAVPKYEAAIQASGEAEYTGDIPIRPDELYGAYVLSSVACANLVEMDPTEALKIEGAVRFLKAKDIPGENNSMKFNFGPAGTPEPIFVEDKISYYGQALGLILATSRQAAEKAAKLVKVKYADEQKPAVSTEAAIEKAKSTGSYAKQTIGKYSTKPSENIEITHTVKGETKFGAQYHFYMETQSVVCHPREDGVDVYCSTQWQDHVQNTVASTLGIPSNSVNVTTRRVGGGFGGKARYSTAVAATCAVATWVSNRPVRIILDLETNMTMLGKRCPYRFPYEVGFDETGRIGSLNIDIICDPGFSSNDSTVFVALMHLQNVYKAFGWEIDTHFVTSNTAANTFCRAPASLQAVAAIEWIMDHVASVLDKDPLEVRQRNFIDTGDKLLFTFGNDSPIFDRQNLIPQIVEQMKFDSDYDNRKAYIEKFNKENRWKKRGMSVLPVRYSFGYFATNLPAAVAIYHMDGHVAVTHAGIEMGQGLNTKVIQTVAHTLQVPMDRIKVKPTNNFTGANAMLTAGSITSELVCYAVLRACEELRENLKPILEKLENPSWEKLIADAHAANVKLTATYTPTNKDELKGYDVWIVNNTETEIDVLTGEYKIIRTDLYEDTGNSLSPAIDLGQVEGGYIMGQGFWTTEKIVHDENTGKLLTTGTWDYKPPECKDVPEDFRITLLNNAPNPFGVLRSKATGEPSVDAAYAVVLAIRSAISSARKETGVEEWFEMEYPVTPEQIANLCCLKDSDITV